MVLSYGQESSELALHSGICFRVTLRVCHAILLKKTGATKYVDRYTVQRISSTATDVLVISAIVGLKLNVIAANFGPL